VTCPCCGQGFRRFRRYGRVDLPAVNRYCPACGTFERHRLLWLYLEQRTALFTAALRVLHFAPEPVLQKRFRAVPDLDYVSVDLDAPLAMVHSDITRLALGSGAFDVVLCSHVLEHVPDDRQAMRELYRVLRPGGWAVVMTPVDLRLETTYEDPSIVAPRERERAFGQHDHVRLYGRDLVNRLREAGFVVRVVTFGSELDAATVARYGLNPYEDIYICTRP
jgi:SAM-dependent methyltransferase